MYPDPDRFDITREPGKHMYFGFGAHYCLGQALARLEGRIVLEEVVKRFPDWDVDLANSRGGEDNVTVVLYGAAPRSILGSAGSALVNLILAFLVAVVVAGAVAALLFASGALQSPP